MVLFLMYRLTAVKWSNLILSTVSLNADEYSCSSNDRRDVIELDKSCLGHLSELTGAGEADRDGSLDGGQEGPDVEVEADAEVEVKDASELTTVEDAVRSGFMCPLLLALAGCPDTEGVGGGDCEA